MFNKILFVCVGNICRSPMAEYWAKDQLQKAGIENVQISSAGLRAMVGVPAVEETAQIMSRFDIDVALHRAQQITKANLIASDIIFVMESWQIKESLFVFPGAHGKIFTLGKWCDEEIRDPYRQGLEAFELTFESIKENWALWQNQLWQNG
ncbi:MAG: low molecular weight protein-tyrosine-phosphatase [Coxiellaceae bacterium]|nr:low molecular weight protein-tyrosine-phosphatase [Coxiellaceae bacterium]